MTAKTKAQLRAENDATIKTGVVGGILAGDDNQLREDVIDSALNIVDTAPQTVAGPVTITTEVLFGSMASFSVDTTTVIAGQKFIYNLTSHSGDTTLTISNADIITASAAKGWFFTVKDLSGTLVANNRKLIIKNEDISILSVAAGSEFTASADHNLAIGDIVVHTAFTDPTYNGTFAVTAIPSSAVYEVSTIAFNATDTGDAVKAIEGLASMDIDADWGVLNFFANGSNLFLGGL